MYQNQLTKEDRDFAEQHPSASVDAVNGWPFWDLWTLPNCRLLIDDLTRDWAYETASVDLVHISDCNGTLTLLEWDFVYQEAFRCLKPGSIIEHTEIAVQPRRGDGTALSCMHPWVLWGNMQVKAGELTGRICNLADDNVLQHLMERHGFLCREVRLRLFLGAPVGSTAQSADLYYASFLDDMEGRILYPFSEIFHWSLDEIRVMAAHLRGALIQDRGLLFHDM
ncbi:methyltransferase [Fusarium sp. NRRL 25303]|nr:methyltransferase [Fusarium sp. NRRL 25303]